MARPYKPPPQGLSESEFGKLVGVTWRAVQKADPARVVRFEDGSIDREASLIAWEANRAHPGGPGRGYTARKERDDGAPDWKDKKERESYLKLKIERMALQGKLVPVELAIAERAETAALIRTRLEGVAPRVADRFGVEVGRVVADEIRSVLEQLADLGEREEG